MTEKISRYFDKKRGILFKFFKADEINEVFE
jgi:hypothetical protein